jgi:hypothetical protein
VNNEQVKALLLRIRPCKTEFSLTMTGKKSSKVNGLYKPDSAEILLHNKNFSNDNELVYTAIHEYAHHLNAEARGGMLSPRAQGASSGPVPRAAGGGGEEGPVSRCLRRRAEFAELAEKIRRECLHENGRLMKRLGELMIEAEELCRKRGARFEDFVDRVLGMSRVTAKATMKMTALGLNPDLGYDGMKLVAGIRDPDERVSAERALLAGKSQDSIKAALKKAEEAEDPKERLVQERERLERSIANLKARLKEVEERLRAMGGRKGGDE